MVRFFVFFLDGFGFIQLFVKILLRIIGIGILHISEGKGGGILRIIIIVVGFSLTFTHERLESGIRGILLSDGY